jgi:transcriptional regulator with XRE-family HTH domain
MNLPEKLVSSRKSKDISQKDMAAKLGISVASLNRYEKGHRIPEVDVLRNVSQITEKPVEWFFDEFISNNEGQEEEGEDEMYRIKYEQKCEELLIKDNIIIELQRQLIESNSKKATLSKKKLG